MQPQHIADSPSVGSQLYAPLVLCKRTQLTGTNNYGVGRRQHSVPGSHYPQKKVGPLARLPGGGVPCTQRLTEADLLGKV